MSTSTTRNKIWIVTFAYLDSLRSNYNHILGIWQFNIVARDGQLPGGEDRYYLCSVPLWFNNGAQYKWSLQE